MPKRILVLGSTGSIGRSTHAVIESLGHDYEIVGLAANGSWETLLQQLPATAARHVALADEQAAKQIRRHLPADVTLHPGSRGLVELVEAVECDLVVSAIVGAAGLPATLRAVELGRDIALANKESLVIAGTLLLPLAQRTNSRLLPVDSEHSAIFQALRAGRTSEVDKIFLTASGGPFRTWDTERIRTATLDEALRHPTWSMGPKVTIDSATLMNKALEVIEAHWLFGVPDTAIEVVVHPESIVHSMVEFCDGSVIAQLGTPDMKTPIQYAVTFPDRVSGLAERLRWSEVRQLNFELPDLERFPLLALGHTAARIGGTCGAVLNAANEAAVERFRAGAFRFGDIFDSIQAVFETHRPNPSPTLEELLACDAWARREVMEWKS